MNEKQAKRLRRAANADRETLRSGPHTGVLVEQLHMLWPSLNHRQRGAVSKYTKGTLADLPTWYQGRAYDLERAATVARAFVLA